MHRYSEKITRYQAVTEEGKACEILERVTYERLPGVEEPVVINRRFDLQTGEPVTRLGDRVFTVDATGARLDLQH